MVSSEDPYQRIRRLLPPLVNLELLALKGHLLIEEQLQRLLEAFSRNPKSLEAARLSFIQKAYLCQALSGCLRSSDPEWRFILDLNALRNRLVHKLEPGDVATLVDEALRVYWKEEFHTPESARQRASYLRNVLVYVIGLLQGCVDGASPRKPPEVLQ
jgi:hypothetical protein